MKFFSRKALVAAATAATISFGGAGAAMAQEGPAADAPAQPVTTTGQNTPDTDKTNKGSSLDGLSSSQGDNKDKNSGDKTKQIRDWIGVFTAVISALGALFGFVNKYLKF
ncbi:hypothetical protein ACL1CX_08415 [Corynebacterium striatum]